MEQMYLIEIFIDKVTVFASENESGANKKLIIKLKFGPKAEFIIKEGQLALNEDNKDDMIECDENGRRKWSRKIRVGKSYLFPSYADTILMILSKFPLEIELWNDDDKEDPIYVGIGNMQWNSEFFHMLKESADPCHLHEPLTIKQNTPIFAECCCAQVGEIDFILRLSALGESIITEFQQLMKDPDSFVFRTNKAPSMFQCKRIEGDNPNFCMIGSLYETTTLEDPDIGDAENQIEICTERQSCGLDQKRADNKCMPGDKDGKSEKKKYPIDKIRMGDITGPCGNTNCPLAQKVKTYIRNLDTYKTEASGKVLETKKEDAKRICGTCDCKDDKWHREQCPENQGVTKVKCNGCGGQAQIGETCEDKQNKMYGTGATPKTSKTQVMYVFSVTKVSNFKESMYGKQYLLDSFNIPKSETSGNDFTNDDSSSNAKSQQNIELDESRPNVSPQKAYSAHSLKNPIIYKVDIKEANKNVPVYNCTEIPKEKDCKCSPPKIAPPCKAFDCACLTGGASARKAHKPYCPSYKHKPNCRVTKMNEEEETKKPKVDDDDNETEPLPYGLSAIKLGPCPVLGRPCTVPDGFARMYKAAVQPPEPPSYSDAGKICCSKEFERIKKAIKEYMKYEKGHDYRCINKFNVDTERRCCDKEQTLLSLMGKSCCGSHKMAIQEKFKEDKSNA